MGKCVKTSVSIPEKIYNKGKMLADEMGLPFSTFLSVLIADKVKQEERKK